MQVEMSKLDRGSLCCEFRVENEYPSLPLYSVGNADLVGLFVRSDQEDAAVAKFQHSRNSANSHISTRCILTSTVNKCKCERSLNRISHGGLGPLSVQRP
jgi:hypothetical protein